MKSTKTLAALFVSIVLLATLIFAMPQEASASKASKCAALATKALKYKAAAKAYKRAEKAQYTLYGLLADKHGSDSTIARKAYHKYIALSDKKYEASDASADARDAFNAKC